jgi:hypothetical protein
MKIRVTMKDPDGMYDCVQDAVTAEVTALGLPADEAEMVIEARAEKVRAAIKTWVEYGEYLTVEFDTDAMTATVVKLGE